jgi:hypothetical protein
MMTFDEARAALKPWAWKDGDKHARCPAHRGDGRNLSVWRDQNGIARFKCHSHDCSTREIIAALGAATARATAAGPRPVAKTHDEKSTRELALRLWREARAARGTIVHDYLFGRGWTGLMPEPLCAGARQVAWIGAGVGLAIPASIRFHPRLKHPSGVWLPAMVAAVEDLRGEIVAIHRTFLKPEGTGKAEVEPAKMALGPISGCAVHLTAGGPELVICEGIETGLSILQATGLHVWAALGTGNLGRVELSAFVREVLIGADNDEPGMSAARIAAEAYRDRGCQVQILSPRTDKADWNDALRR